MDEVSISVPVSCLNKRWISLFVKRLNKRPYFGGILEEYINPLFDQYDRRCMTESFDPFEQKRRNISNKSLYHKVYNGVYGSIVQRGLFDRPYKRELKHRESIQLSWTVPPSWHYTQSSILLVDWSI